MNFLQIKLKASKIFPSVSVYSNVYRDPAYQHSSYWLAGSHNKSDPLQNFGFLDRAFLVTFGDTKSPNVRGCLTGTRLLVWPVPRGRNSKARNDPVARGCQGLVQLPCIIYTAGVLLVCNGLSI
jgi:hypothetical protein